MSIYSTVLYNSTIARGQNIMNSNFEIIKNDINKTITDAMLTFLKTYNKEKRQRLRQVQYIQ